MKVRPMSCKIILALAAVFGIGIAQTCWAQGPGGTGGTGGTTTSTSSSTSTTTGNGTTTTQSQAGSVSGMTDALQLGDLLTIGPEFTRETVFESERIQPFVGPSSENIIHPRSQLEAGSTLGSSGGGGGGFTFSTGGQNRAGTTGFGATGTTGTGFTVSRRGVRGALRYTPTSLPSGEIVRSNFSSRLIRLSALQNVGSINMSVDNRVATLRGVVASDEQKSLLARQAELEPGVDRVVNELEVSK